MFLVEESEKIELGCSFGDLLCIGAEQTAQGLGSFVGWLAQIVLGTQDLAPGSTLWENAIGEASNWFAVSIVVMLATAIIGLSTGMLSMKPGRVWMTLGGIAAGIPSTYLALGVGGELLRISDQMSNLTMQRIGGKDGFENVFRAAAQGGTGSDDVGAIADLVSGGVASAIPTILMLIGLILGLILMSFALAFRNLGLMVLIAFAPLAFMAVPMKGGWGIAKKWGLAGIALLLAKPLMFGVLAMVLKSADGMALFSPQTLTVMTGLFVVSFMPMMAYSFFSFLGAGNENMAGQGMAGQAGRSASAPVQRVAGAAVSRGASGAAGAVGRSFSSSKPSPGGSGGGAGKGVPDGPKPGGGKTPSGDAAPGKSSQAPASPPAGGGTAPGGGKPAAGNTPSVPSTPPRTAGAPKPAAVPSAPGAGSPPPAAPAAAPGKQAPRPKPAGTPPAPKW